MSGAGVAGTGTEPLTVLSVMLRSADYLAEKGVENARLDAEHLLAHALGVGRLEMYLQHERPMTEAELESFRPLLKRRGQREPLQYILGRQGFRELDLEVGPGVLIPRPETEQLVGHVLDWARERTDLLALDLGTGSGAIALSLLVEGPFTRVVATDASPKALAYAARNGAALGLDSRLELREGSLFGTLDPGETFDVVVSNPPYVAERDRAGLQEEVADWEPQEALFAGNDGLAVLRELVPGVAAALKPGGLLALEIGEGQAEGVVELLDGAGAYEDTTVHRDLAGRKRVVTARRAAGRADKGG